MLLWPLATYWCVCENRKADWRGYVGGNLKFIMLQGPSFLSWYPTQDGELGCTAVLVVTLKTRSGWKEGLGGRLVKGPPGYEQTLPLLCWACTPGRVRVYQKYWGTRYKLLLRSQSFPCDFLISQVHPQRVLYCKGICVRHKRKFYHPIMHTKPVKVYLYTLVDLQER